VSERDGRLSQSGDAIMPVPGIHGLLRSGTSIEIEEVIRLGGNLSTHYQGARCGEKVGTDLGTRPEAGFISGGEQISLRPARRRWWRIRIGRGETGFPVQTSRVGHGKTVGDPPTDPIPKDGHSVHASRGGALNNRPVEENQG